MRWSLKWKIQFWHGLILIVVVFLLGTLFYRHERESMIRETDWMLDHSREPIMSFANNELLGRLGGPSKGKRPNLGWEDIPSDWEPAGFQAPGVTEGNPRDHGGPVGAFAKLLEPQGYYFILWDRSAERLISSKNAPDIERPTILARGAWRRVIPDERREIYQRTRNLYGLVGRYTDGIDANLNALKMRLFTGGAFLIGASLLIGNFLVFRSLRPLSNIRATSKDVADGKLTERIQLDPKENTIEMVELSKDLNSTYASLEKLFERQASFTADASHELRTPLTALIAQVKRGQKGGRTEDDYQAIFDICDRSLTRLKRIVEDLLELSRFDSGRVELDREDLAIDMLVSTIAEDYRPMIEERGSMISSDVTAACAYCDPFRIEQVISNLITNALNHNSESVSISLSVKTDESWVIVTVEDNGVGIPAEYHEFLFDRFFQEKKSGAQSDSSKKSKNSGLGLAISKAIVEAHGGTIRVRSELNVSTVFEVRLPREAPTSV